MSFQHWNYVLALEDDLMRIGRYVELAPANFPVYSVEISRTLMTACQEVDVLLKLICLSKGKPSRNIKDYINAIPSIYPTFSKSKIALPYQSLEFSPYCDWDDGRIPNWWTANNQIKHHRSEHFGEGNLENMLHALCALLIANLFYYDSTGEIGSLEPTTKYLAPINFGDSMCPSAFGLRSIYEIPTEND